jgi:hypothetical protein
LNGDGITLIVRFTSDLFVHENFSQNNGMKKRLHKLFPVVLISLSNLNAAKNFRLVTPTSCGPFSRFWPIPSTSGFKISMLHNLMKNGKSVNLTVSIWSDRSFYFTSFSSFQRQEQVSPSDAWSIRRGRFCRHFAMDSRDQNE